MLTLGADPGCVCGVRRGGGGEGELILIANGSNLCRFLTTNKNYQFTAPFRTGQTAGVDISTNNKYRDRKYKNVASFIIVDLAALWYSGRLICDQSVTPTSRPISRSSHGMVHIPDSLLLIGKSST